MAGARADGRARLLGLLLLSTQTMAAWIPPHVIFERQSSCPDPNFRQCPGGLPGNFCCAAGATCLALAANTTALCCPAGSTCDVIEPITCDITQQNVAINPLAPLKTTALQSQLPRCGAGCCPFGYSCTDTGRCVRNADQSVPPPGVAVPSSATPPAATQTSIQTSAPATPGTAAPAATTSSAPVSQGGFPTVAVVVGILGGLLGGAALTVAILMFIGWRRRRGQKGRNSGGAAGKGASDGVGKHGSNSSFGHGYISDPIVHDGQTLRTDFIRKNPPPRTPSLSRARFTSIFRRESSASNGSSNHGYPMARSSPPPPLPVIKFDNTTLAWLDGSDAKKGQTPPPGYGSSPRQQPQPPSTPPHRDGSNNRNSVGSDSSVPPVRIAPIRALRPAFDPARGLPSRPNTTVSPHAGTGSSRMRREPSSESINVFADPDTVQDSPVAVMGRGPERRPNLVVGNAVGAGNSRRLSHMTTFTDMMEHAELGPVHRGEERFVPDFSTPRR